MYAFRCRACGHFEPASHAGESLQPHACSVCGAGIIFNPKTGNKSFEPMNWEILADCTKERLKELDLDGQVETHLPLEFVDREPRQVSVETQNTLGLKSWS